MSGYRTSGKTSSSLSGHLLMGNELTQLIYADEAGNDDNSDVTVVAGVIVDADTKIFDAERLIEETVGAVPKEFWDLSIPLSAKVVWGDRRVQEVWPRMVSRKRFIEQMVSIPRRLGLPIGYSLLRRERQNILSVPNLSPVQLDHVLALAPFAGSVDRYIRNHCGPKEVGMIFYEDMPEFRLKISKSFQLFRNPEAQFELSDEHLNWTPDEVAQGYTEQFADMRIERLRNSVAFVSKGEDPLILLADFVAYAFRRYFNNEKFGDDFMIPMLGHLPDKGVWARPQSEGVIRWD